MFDAIVQVVKEDYNIDLLKKVMPGQSTPTSPKGTRRNSFWVQITRKTKQAYYKHKKV
ncbi:hypothetical protein MASR1M46_16110 [Bacteroidales bacterium]